MFMATDQFINITKTAFILGLCYDGVL